MDPPGWFGGAEGIRTPDLLSAIQARSQLRHSPKRLRSVPYLAPRRQNV